MVLQRRERTRNSLGGIFPSIFATENRIADVAASKQKERENGNQENTSRRERAPPRMHLISRCLCLSSQSIKIRPFFSSPADQVSSGTRRERKAPPSWVRKLVVGRGLQVQRARAALHKVTPVHAREWKRRRRKIMFINSQRPKQTKDAKNLPLFRSFFSA